MCNIAGYIGDESAAPILLEMTERQQGFAGGYSTGIATICDGELHSVKVVGDVSTLPPMDWFRYINVGCRKR